MNMKALEQTAKLVSDQTRIRMLMLLSEKELCVCQLMGILGISQPLISRNLSLLEKGGFLESRREGKLMFYRISRDLPSVHAKFLDAFREALETDETLREDREALVECTEFQKIAGRCDMKTYTEFLEKRKKERERNKGIS